MRVSNKGCIRSFAQWLHGKPLHSLLEVTRYSFFHILYLFLKARALQGLCILHRELLCQVTLPVPFGDMVCEARAVLSAWGSAVVFTPSQLWAASATRQGKMPARADRRHFALGDLRRDNICGHSLSQVFRKQWIWGPPG